MSNGTISETSGITIQIDGQAVDLADASWIKVASCGCTSGVTIAFSDYGSGPVQMVLTADQAAAQFAESAAEIRRDKERGFTFRAIRRQDLGDMKCPHDPKWGYTKPPKVDGYEWSAVDALGARSSLTHLVPSEAIEAAKARDFTKLDVKPLCGGKAAFWWKTDWYVVDGKVECKRCEAKGAAVIAASRETEPTTQPSDEAVAHV